MVPSSVPMSTLDLMDDQRALELLLSSLLMMLEMLFNNSMDTTGKVAHSRFVRIVLQVLVLASEVVEDSVALVVDLVEGLVAVAALVVVEALEARHLEVVEVEVMEIPIKEVRHLALMVAPELLPPSLTPSLTMLPLALKEAR